VFVSHDRYFIDGLATRVFEVEDRRVHIYPGNYEDYLYRKSGGPEKTTTSLAADLKPTPPPAAVVQDHDAHRGPAVISDAPQRTTESGKPATPVKRLNPIKLKQLEDRVATIEQQLSTIDARITAAEESLGHYTSAEESQRTASQLESLRIQRNILTTEWEQHATALEEQSTAV
jgi:ATP-binding cassette, subfamily F, member 3